MNISKEELGPGHNPYWDALRDTVGYVVQLTEKFMAGEAQYGHGNYALAPDDGSLRCAEHGNQDCRICAGAQYKIPRVIAVGGDPVYILTGV